MINAAKYPLNDANCHRRRRRDMPAVRDAKRVMRTYDAASIFAEIADTQARANAPHTLAVTSRMIAAADTFPGIIFIWHFAPAYNSRNPCAEMRQPR